MKDAAGRIAANVAKLPEFFGNGAGLENAPSLSAVLRSLLDFRRNLVQPFLGTICPILIVSDIRLESIYLIVSSPKLLVSGSQLVCKFLSDFPRLSEVCRSLVCRPTNQPEDSIPCAVYYFGFRTGIFRFKCIRNSGFNTGVQRRRIRLLTSHCSPRTTCPRYFSTQAQAYAI
jgi:hypothetical protein